MIVVSEARHKNMSAIHAKDTRPELFLRRALHRDGFRFRLHDKTLVGTPDIVLSKYRAVILVNGCFWHCHECSAFRWPATRADFWKEKLLRNRARDQRVGKELRDAGWRLAVVWECALGTAGRSCNTVNALEQWIVGDLKDLELTE